MATLSEQIAKALRAKDVGAVKADPWTTAPSRRVDAILGMPAPDLLAELGYPQLRDQLQRLPQPVQTAVNLLAPSAADIVGGAGRRLTRAAILGKDLLDTGVQRMAKRAPDNLRHPIGLGKLLSRPLEEMQFTRQRATRARDVLPTRTIDPQELAGSAIIPLPGDRSIGGQVITRIGGVPVEVPTFGGPSYMRSHSPHGVAWASTQEAAGRLSNRAKEARQLSETGKVYGVYVPQGHESMHFSTMMPDAVMQQVRAQRPHRADVRAFDAAIRKEFPEWVGLLHPKAEEQLMTRGQGGLRHHVMKQMDKTKLRTQQGFPDLAQTRAALTEADLLNTPSYHGGFAVAELDPGFTVRGRGPVHPTYEAQLPGRYVGQLEQAVPLERLFPAFARQRAALEKALSADYRALTMGLPIQRMTPTAVRGIEQAIRKTR